MANWIPSDGRTLSKFEADSIALEEMESSVNVRELCCLLRQGKKTVAMVTVGAVMLAISTAFVLPIQYTATTAFIPPGSSLSGIDMISGQSARASGLENGTLDSAKNPGELYVGILKSRSIAADIVRRFHLQGVYGVRKESEAEDMLASHSNFSVGIKNSIVSVSVTDKSADRARDMANEYLDALQSKNVSLALAESSERRRFFAARLTEEKSALANAEEALKKSREHTGLIAPQGQTSAGIRATAQLRSQISLRKVRLASLLQSETDQSVDVERLNEEIKSLEGQVVQMQDGKSGAPSGPMPSAQIPRLELDVVRATRELAYHEALFESIARQYEAAGLDEANKTSLRILDRAVTPDSRSAPARLFIIFGGLLLGISCGSISVLLQPKIVGFLRKLS